MVTFEPGIKDSTTKSTTMMAAAPAVTDQQQLQPKQDGAPNANNCDGDHNDNSDDDASEDGHNVESTWDEGGPSDCGYNESVHKSFMAAGEAVHSLVGAPSEQTRKWQAQVSNWFQELSYTARDLLRGDTNELADDAQKAVNTLYYGEKEEDDDQHQDDDDNAEEKKDGNEEHEQAAPVSA